MSSQGSVRGKLPQTIENLRNSPEDAMQFLNPYVRAFEAYAEAPNLVVPIAIDKRP
jgi:hypothetical protein